MQISERINYNHELNSLNTASKVVPKHHLFPSWKSPFENYRTTSGSAASLHATTQPIASINWELEVVLVDMTGRSGIDALI